MAAYERRSKSKTENQHNSLRENHHYYYHLKTNHNQLYKKPNTRLTDIMIICFSFFIIYNYVTKTVIMHTGHVLRAPYKNLDQYSDRDETFAILHAVKVKLKVTRLT